MSREFSVFLASSGLTLLAGFAIRTLALADAEGLSLELVDFARDLFAAAAAVFPTTLIIQPEREQAILVAPSDVLTIVLVVMAILLWGKGESRYLRHWRKGKERLRQHDGSLSAPQPAAKPGRRKALAFVVGNGLGFLVLFASTTLSQQMIS
ncbi:MAG TPA: hypothetical protein VFU04_08680 [Solirubrobacterales bacterium]|nr:hypothetical protein [Solirubrobacterales bacterium]